MFVGHEIRQNQLPFLDIANSLPGGKGKRFLNEIASPDECKFPAPFGQTLSTGPRVGVVDGGVVDTLGNVFVSPPSR